MEPTPQLTSEVLPSDFMDALKAADTDTILVNILKATHEDTPLAAFAEALGSRLQVRGFLRNQKAGLAQLHGIVEGTVEQSVRTYFSTMDAELTQFTAFGAEDQAAEAERLKAGRLQALTDAFDNNETAATQFVSHFAEQPADKSLNSTQLADRTINLRNDIVSLIWAPVQSELEGDDRAAVSELKSSVEAASADIDRLLPGVVDWQA